MAQVAYGPVEPLLTIEEALAHVLGRVRPLPSERVPLAAAARRVLAEDGRAGVDLPPLPRSPCHRARARPWTVSRSGQTTCLAGSPSCFASRQGDPRRARSGRARRW